MLKMKMKTKTIKFKREFKRENFWVICEVPKDFTMSVYLSEYVFLNAIKDGLIRINKLSRFFKDNGRISNWDKKELEKVKILKIEREKAENTPFLYMDDPKEVREEYEELLKERIKNLEIIQDKIEELKIKMKMKKK